MTGWRQYANDHPRAVDAALIVLLVCAAGGQANLNSGLPDVHLGFFSAGPPAIAAAVALLWRRERPRAVVAFTALCAGAEGVFGYLVTPVNLAPLMVALYELAVRVPARTAGRHYVVVTTLVIVAAAAGNRYGYPWALVILNPVLFLLLPVALGLVHVLRRAAAEREAHHRVAEERMRIARELHDVVAHHLALANAQAGTAAYLARSHPDQVERILTDLAGTTSAALREMKATVGLLRQPGEDGSPLEPAPGLGQLPALTAGFASAGLDVVVTVEGEQRRLSPDVDLAAFRIVQEALTNVTRHAATGTADVRLSYDVRRLTITVTNDGATAPASPGFGLLGMRERALSAGGRCQAGPDAGGRFTVTTELPVPA